MVGSRELDTETFTDFRENDPFMFKSVEPWAFITGCILYKYVAPTSIPIQSASYSMKYNEINHL